MQPRRRSSAESWRCFRGRRCSTTWCLVRMSVWCGMDVGQRLTALVALEGAGQVQRFGGGHGGKGTGCCTWEGAPWMKRPTQCIETLNVDKGLCGYA